MNYQLFSNHRFNFIFQLFCILVLSLGCWVIFSLPVHSATGQIERIPLTIEQLEERLNNPVVQNGISMIDLQNFTINLQPENATFRDQFYRLLQIQLNRPKTRTGLNLSNALINGDFITSNLGLRIPLLGETLLSLFSPDELLQLNQGNLLKPLAEPNPLMVPEITVLRSRIKLENTTFLGLVDFSKTFFLNEINAKKANFREEFNALDARFSQELNLNEAKFAKKAGFQHTAFSNSLQVNQVVFKDTLSFNDSEFQGKVDFQGTEFQGLASFHNCLWGKTPNFNKTWWKNRAIFSKSQFLKSVNFHQGIFEKSINFRNTQFSQEVNLTEVSLQELIDFSDIEFDDNTFLNLSNLNFESTQAQIVGDPGIIGKIIKVPRLEGNKNLLRNLIQNFRQQERIADANQIEYLRANLRLKHLREQIFTLNLTPYNWLFFWRSLNLGISCLQLTLLILLSGYGTCSELVFGVGIIIIAYFGLLFWFIDRYRRRVPTPILPTRYETIWMLSSFSVLSFIGLTEILSFSNQPLLSLLCLILFLVPVPAILLIILYQRGRYHNLMDVSYFTEDGTMRQLRLMIGKLPIMPRYPLFRERHLPLLWTRRWNWLNYYDFSLNNFLKIGFNDLRLRDEHLPGIITTLVWYQWGLGLLYLTLLLWTLSRTIPGLNLLIYLK